jgi:hypothetical protein
MDYPVEKSTEPAPEQALAGQPNGAAKLAKPLVIRNQHGQFMPGSCANPLGPKGKKPITAALAAFVGSPEGQKAILKAARSQVRTSQYQSAMATYVRETLEGKLTERVEIAGGLELAARIRRARQRLAAGDNDSEEHTGENE